jgi:hypothetical protein
MELLTMFLENDQCRKYIPNDIYLILNTEKKIDRNPQKSETSEDYVIKNLWEFLKHNILLMGKSRRIRKYHESLGTLCKAVGHKKHIFSQFFKILVIKQISKENFDVLYLPTVM